MQQVIVLNYSKATADIYTISTYIDPEKWLTDNGFINNDCLWMAKEGIIRITIHD